MSKINWRKTLGWNEEQLDDLRVMAYAYIRQGKYDIALPIFEALCVIDPESSYDAQTLGALYLELGNPNKALKWFDRALKIDADHAPTLLNLAKTFFLLGKKNDGLKLAQILAEEKNPIIANTAKALLLAYE
jgi:tetratricopeptide (TPR) repeat protein